MNHASVKQQNKKWWLLLYLLSGVITLSFAQQNSNDHIFPAAPKAKMFIDFDSKGFIVKGKRTFLVSAGIEYARVPHQLWHDRLLRLQRAGFNCVEIYTFWNFHEPHEGEFAFTGDRDLNLFLQEVKQLGMYAIVRVGPYYCAEWENGGYPLWLRFKPGVRVREDNIEFEKYVDRFFDKLLPVVFKNQINNGGCVIMIQLENEHPKGWGTYMPDGYFKHLQSKALSLGLDVPYFFSGLHHASDPAGAATSLDDSTRPNPWFSTEFWSIWYSVYSSGAKDAKKYERRTWKIIAHGGNGYNYYMAHGGTNFSFTNNNEDAASYDYGAAVGQAGDLRPIYYSFKKMAWFARSFQNILENSADATKEWDRFVADTSVVTTARKSPAGEIIFIDNSSNISKKINLNINDKHFTGDDKSIALASKEIFPVVHNYKLTDAVNITWSVTRIFGIIEQGNTTSMVIYGEPGTNAAILFSINKKEKISRVSKGLTISSNNIYLKTKFAEDVPAEYSFSINGKKIRIIAVSSALADNTWFIENAKEPYIICGPSYVGDINQQKNNRSVITEEPWLNGKQFPVWTYNNASVIKIKMQQSLRIKHQQSIALNKWKRKDASLFAAVNYNDSGWKYNADPLPMGADGNLTCNAWYRTSVDIDSAGVYTLQLEGVDRITSFADGQIAGNENMANGEITFNFSKGKHILAFFAAHDGLDKFAGYLGPIDSVDRKGLFGPVILKKGGPTTQKLTEWEFLKAPSIDDVNNEIPSSSSPSWKNYSIGKDAFSKKEGFGWFQTYIPKPPAGTLQIEIKFRSIDENATVFINNKKIIRHEGWNQPFKVTIDDADTISRPLLLTAFIENYSNEGGIDGAVNVNYIGSSVPVKGWRMFGDQGDPKKMGTWKNTDRIFQKGKPAFYTTTFTIKDNTNVNDYPIWRIVADGLGHGSIWVNEHNLGRYPEKINAPGLYIPECWLHKGSNTLLIYDEDGKDPSKVSIQSEAAAGRVLTKLIF